MLPLGRAVAPGAVSGGGVVVRARAVIGWLGLLLRWWSFVALGEYFTVVVKTREDQPGEERAMTAALGNRYREFAASRARLIPYIW